MKSCFGYVRVSTVKQGDGVSLEAQREAIAAFAERNALTISEWFEEKETAAKRGRPIFNKMIGELMKGKATGLIVHKIDRSARNFTDWAKIGDLADAGVNIHFANENLDFKSRGGRLTADIQAVIAADYVRNLREETIKGLTGRLKQGLYPFKAPLGYLDTGRGNAKVIDPVRGPLVRRLFELYATGEYSLWSLPREAYAIGLCNEREHPVAKSGIEKILRNPFYTGIIHIRRTGRSYSGMHEPLISPALFERVSDVRAERDNKKSTKHNHRYRGLFRCGHCQGAMIAELQKNRVYYRCHLKSCPTKTVREDLIEGAALDFLKRYTLTEQQVDLLRRRFEEWLVNSSDEDESKRAAFELAKLDERLSRLTDKFIDNHLDDTTFNTKKTALLLERKRWETATENGADLDGKRRHLERYIELTKSLYSNYVSAASAQKRELVKFATSNRFVRGKNIYLEPSNWLRVCEQVLILAPCDPRRPTDRTEVRDDLMGELLSDGVFELEFHEFQQAD